MLIEKWKRENNLFKFATKETSQDSFFSWVIQGINCNYPDRIENYNLAKEFLKEISPQGLKEDIDKVYEVKIIRQFLNIDILLVLNMSNGKQKFLIIENKTSSGLRNNQKESILYYTKFLDEIKNKRSMNIFDSWEIYCNSDNIEDNIYSVLIRTNLELRDDFNHDENEIKKYLMKLDRNYDFLKNDNFFDQHINFINNKEKIEKIVELFKKYQNTDKLIKDYYDALVFNLENDSVLNSSENSIEFINKNGILEEDKTHFRTAYMCLACFNNILKNPIKIDEEKINTRSSVRIVDVDINPNTDTQRRKIIVLTLDFNNGNEFGNFFIQDNIWQENQEKESTDDIRYVYLFTKENDCFNNTYYTFRGLFRFLKRVNNIKYWKKCRIGEHGKISIKKEDIEKYIKIEEDLGNDNA
ncbi:MAG: hypothetical protein IJ068_05405 [Bacilli bacterium]|nr:hypothetical protein [Bacilli bacterium]